MVERVYGALVLGLLAFVGVASLLSERVLALATGAGGNGVWRMATSIFALASVASVGGVGRAMPRRARARLRGRAAPGRDDLLRLYVPYVLVRGALIEGLGFFGATVYMVSGLCLGVLVAAAAIGGLLVTYPTRERFRGFRDRLTGGPT